MKYVVIALLALILGGLIGRAIWAEKPAAQPVDPVQIIVTQVRTHAVIEHERQIAIWYRACPAVIGKTPQIFVAWPAKLIYQLELNDVQVKREGTVITVSTPAIHSAEPSVPTDFMDTLATTSIFTFANEQELVNHEISKASPIARYLTNYFMIMDPSVKDDFAEELRTLVEHLAGALGVPFTRIDVDIPNVVVREGQVPKLPKLELCAGTSAAVNGLPFAKAFGDVTEPVFSRMPQRQHSGGVINLPHAGESGKGTATLVPAPAPPQPRGQGR